MTKRDSKSIHSDRLLPSSMDHVLAAQEIEARFLRLCELYLKIRGEKLPIPRSLSRDMYRWRRMRVRHRCQRCKNQTVMVIPEKQIMRCSNCGGSGDYRHTEAEWRSAHAVAQWTVDVNCELRNQPRKIIEWGPA